MKLKDKNFFRLSYNNNFDYYFYLNPKDDNPKGKIFYCKEDRVYAFISKITYNKKDRKLTTKFNNKKVIFEENYELIIDDNNTNHPNQINDTNITDDTNNINDTNITDTNNINDTNITDDTNNINDTNITDDTNNINDTNQTIDINDTNQTIDINDTNITSEPNNMNDSSNIHINIIDESNEINDTNITSEPNNMNDSNNMNQIIDVNDTNNLDIINEISETSETNEENEQNEPNENDEKYVIDKLEKQVFSEYSRFLDSNGRRMKRIMNMYFVSRKYFYKKSNIKNSFVTRNMLLPNIIFAEQWPYCLSMIIVYLENLLFNGKKAEYISDLKIIDILNKLKNRLFLNDKWRKLSYNDSRIDKLELFLKHLDENNLNSYLLFFIQRNFIFNLNPSIKSYILKDIDELKLNDIDIN